MHVYPGGAWWHVKKAARGMQACRCQARVWTPCFDCALSKCLKRSPGESPPSAGSASVPQVCALRAWPMRVPGGRVRSVWPQGEAKQRHADASSMSAMIRDMACLDGFKPQSSRASANSSWTAKRGGNGARSLFAFGIGHGAIPHWTCGKVQAAIVQATKRKAPPPQRRKRQASLQAPTHQASKEPHRHCNRGALFAYMPPEQPSRRFVEVQAQLLEFQLPSRALWRSKLASQVRPRRWTRRRRRSLIRPTATPLKKLMPACCASHGKTLPRSTAALVATTGGNPQSPRP